MRNLFLLCLLVCSLAFPHELSYTNAKRYFKPANALLRSDPLAVEDLVADDALPEFKAEAAVAFQDDVTAAAQNRATLKKVLNRNKAVKPTITLPLENRVATDYPFRKAEKSAIYMDATAVPRRVYRENLLAEVKQSVKNETQQLEAKQATSENSTAAKKAVNSTATTQTSATAANRPLAQAKRSVSVNTKKPVAPKPRVRPSYPHPMPLRYVKGFPVNNLEDDDEWMFSG